jgi:hypothetical protein
MSLPRPPRAALLLLVAPGLAACKSDNTIKDISVDQVAVTTGDFDRMEETLIRSDTLHDVFEGYISQAIYDPEVDPTVMNPKVEELFTGVNEDGDPLVVEYDALLVNSGTRGFGAYVYNGVDTDDRFLVDPAVPVAMEAFVSQARTLVVSDWSYELVELVWPDQIRFFNEAEGADAAQAGVSESVVAEVVAPGLRELLQADALELQFDFSYWTVIEDVGPDVDVYLRGDVEVRDPNGQGAVPLTDVPLLVGFDAGFGRVVFSAFSWKAQTPEVADLMLSFAVEGLEVEPSGDQLAGAEDAE